MLRPRNFLLDYCFPFRWESRKVFETALNYDATDAKAYYYLGNLLYDKQPKWAISYWEKALSQDAELAMAHRNLGWGYFREEKDLDKAIAAYEQAIKIDKSYPRFFDELDRLYERKGTEIEKRDQLLKQNHTTLKEHSSALLREALVANANMDYDRSSAILTQHYFNRQEGRSGLHDIYVDACLLNAKELMGKEKWDQALAALEAADLYPENQSIGEGRKLRAKSTNILLQRPTCQTNGKEKRSEILVRESPGD